MAAVGVKAACEWRAARTVAAAVVAGLALLAAAVPAARWAGLASETAPARVALQAVGGARGRRWWLDRQGRLAVFFAAAGFAGFAAAVTAPALLAARVAGAEFGEDLVDAALEVLLLGGGEGALLGPADAAVAAAERDAGAALDTMRAQDGAMTDSATAPAAEASEK